MVPAWLFAAWLAAMSAVLIAAIVLGMRDVRRQRPEAGR